MAATKILVVDDDASLRMAMARTLGNAGYEVSVAGDAVAAVSTAVHETPDLVLLDIGLPAGSGVVVLERLRNIVSTSLVSVVVITGSRLDYDRGLTLQELGCNIVLTKLVASADLLDAVSRALAAAAGAPVESPAI